jgi:putative ABC transport system permease protein
MALLEHIAHRLRPLPGVREAAYGNALPLLTSGGFRGFKMRPPIDPSVEVEANVMERVVSPGYFGALGLRVTAGRPLEDTDTLTSPQVIVANRSFAAKYLGAHPIGTAVPNLGMCRGDHDRWDVVGVVNDMRQESVTDRPQPELFLPARQVGCTSALSQAVVVVRTSGDPPPYAATVRSVVHEQEPSIAVDSVMTMEDRVINALAKPRLYAVVLAGFAGFAVVIAAVGLFGVLSYCVAQRTREFGVRAALGAQTHDIVGLVIRQALWMVGVGLLLGLPAALAGVRLLSTFLYGVSPHDGLTFVAVPFVLVAVAVIACLVPVRRAVKVDPLAAIRAA